MEHFTIKCDECGERDVVDVHRKPNHRLEVVTLAKRQGWPTVHDERQNEIRIYCCAECKSKGENRR